MRQKKEGVMTNGQDVVMNASTTLLRFRSPWPYSLFFRHRLRMKRDIWELGQGLWCCRVVRVLVRHPEPGTG